MTIQKKPMATNQKIFITKDHRFIPLVECPFTDSAAATVPNITYTMDFDVPTGAPEIDTDWNNVIGAIIPSFIIAALFSTCYICYR
jgi:hypothetical protein